MHPRSRGNSDSPIVTASHVDGRCIFLTIDLGPAAMPQIDSSRGDTETGVPSVVLGVASLSDGEGL